MKQFLKRLSQLLPDKLYLQIMYFKHFHKFINFNNPKTFNEKLQWLKIYDRKPIYTMMVDKYRVKDYIKNKLGEEYVIPTLGVWKTPEEIEFDSLPNQFVLKWNHDSGSVVICEDKNKLDIEEAIRKLTPGKTRSGFWYGREWPYKNVEPCIIAEKYMEDTTSKESQDYKIHNFKGVPRVILVCLSHFSEEGIEEELFDLSGKKINVKRTGEQTNDININATKELNKMLEFVERISKDYPFMQTDFYEVEGRVYFGEITLCSSSGFSQFSPNENDNVFGEWFKIPGEGYVVKYKNSFIWIHEEQEIKQNELKDYKFYCFNGNVKLLGIYSDRNKECPTKADYFDENYNWIDIKWGYQHAEHKPEKPEKFKEMLYIAEQLAKDFVTIRIDLYLCDGKIYFGELTFFDGSGFDKIEPIEWDYKLGSWIELPLTRI